ncbi:homoserine kinase [Thermaurantiacus sp.]
MAVYTEVPAEELARFVARYGVGTLVMAKGIAEGVSNSNYLLETTGGRFILTLYERRIEASELPWFLGLMTHLADAGLPVPRPMPDQDGRVLQRLCGRDAALITWLPGVSVTEPTLAQCRAAGEALAQLHLAGAGYPPTRPNQLGLPFARDAAAALGYRLDVLEPGLFALVQSALARLDGGWPEALPRGIIHADLFPDNVLFLGDCISGLIDFYFAAEDWFAYDLAVLRVAWSFTADGARFLGDRDAALRIGYESVRLLAEAEVAALPLLSELACLRFLLTRALDHFEESAGALVQRKDPLAFARRLRHIRCHG